MKVGFYHITLFPNSKRKLHWKIAIETRKPIVPFLYSMHFLLNRQPFCSSLGKSRSYCGNMKQSMIIK